MVLWELWTDWIWFATFAFGTATTLTASVYLLANFLMNEKMKSWAKMELVEIFYSAVLISLAIPTIVLTDQVVQGALTTGPGGTPGCIPGNPRSAWIPVVDQGGIVLPGQERYICLDICGEAIAADDESIYHDVDSCHMRLGMWYLREVFDETKNFAFDVYLSYIWTSILAEFTINVEFIFEKSGFFTFTPWRGFFTMGNTIKALVFDWAMKVMMLAKFQEVMLRFIATALFPALFVMGALLRTFSFTRRLGGLLLGLAIALYFIFPAFYAFGGLIMLDIKNRAYPIWIADTEANPHGHDNPDPPIANAMFIRGNFHMIGGDGNFSTEEAREALWRFEGMSSEDYYENLESGDSDYIPRYDFSAQVTDDEEVRNSTLLAAWGLAQDWFERVSEEDKYDQFITFAWERNGPIDTLARLTFWSVFFSLFSIIGTIAVIRSLSMTFGGDIEIAGLTRLI